MNLILTNPWGLLGLLGVPALILIYYLRRRAKIVTISTVFLLKRAQRESAAGRRFDHFNHSLPFWLQLLGVLLLTWLLVQPKYGHSRTTRQIAIVLDSSASMQPLRKTLGEKLRERLPQMQGDAEHASLILFDHEPRRPRLYQGDDPDALIASLDQWDPSDGALDPLASLRLARSLVGPNGIVVFVTDHEGPTLPLSAQRLALGSPLANVGFTGVTFHNEGDVVVWSAIIRNYSDSIQTRSWTLETPDQQRTDPVQVSVPPRRFATLKGRIPSGHSRCLLRLSDDSFTLDDTLPIIAPQPRVARLEVKLAPDLESLSQQMIRGFAHVIAATDEVDLILTTTPVGEIPSSEKPLISDVAMPAGESSQGRIIVSEDALVQGLNWQALRVGPVATLAPRAEDLPLVWLDEKPLIIRRQDAKSGASQLIFTFSLNSGNALKLPSTAVLLHRFCEMIARNTLAPGALVLETSQLISPELPDGLDFQQLNFTVTELDGTSGDRSLPSNFRTILRAPVNPCFLSLHYQGKPLLEAAVHFADTREADLSASASVELGTLTSNSTEITKSDDHLWRWFVVGLLLLVLAAWYFLGRSHPTPEHI